LKARPRKKNLKAVKSVKKKIQEQKRVGELDISKLKILDKKIVECNKCSNLRKNGIAIPSWTKDSKYGVILEAPGREEIEVGVANGTGRGIPLVGAAGRLMWNKIWNMGALERKDFLVINTVQCRPVKDGKNGKPIFSEIRNCNFWVKRYIEASGIEKWLVCGNYAYYYFQGIDKGITHRCGGMEQLKFFGNMDLLLYPCVHPASLLYPAGAKSNKLLLENSIKKFLIDVM